MTHDEQMNTVDELIALVNSKEGSKRDILAILDVFATQLIMSVSEKQVIFALMSAELHHMRVMKLIEALMITHAADEEDTAHG